MTPAGKAAKNRRNREYRMRNAAVVSVEQSRRRYRAKLELIRVYSAGTFKCAKCEEKRIGALTVEHTNQDGGGKDRQTANFYKMFVALKKLGFPPGFEILCANCNWKVHLGTIRTGLSMVPSAVRTREYNRVVKERLMTSLGGECAVCHNSDMDVLTVHHLNGDGATHRATVSGGCGSGKFYRKVVKSGDLTGMECRCLSCNDEEEWRSKHEAEFAIN